MTQIDIPNLQDYDISPDYGFLPPESSLETDLDPYYAKWDHIARNLQRLQLCNRLRSVVNELPVLSCSRLKTLSELRRAYSMLAFICHAYIWAGNELKKVVPPSLSIPFLFVCKTLDLPPVATYAAVVLWNFTPVFPLEEYASLENLTTLLTFTGSMDESWFYLVSVAVEGRGGPLISLMLESIRAVSENDCQRVVQTLQSVAQGLKDISCLMERIYEKRDPHIFFHHIRPFLMGSKNIGEAGLPKGVIFDDGTGKSQPVQFSGGSNAQSSLIQLFDIVLGVDHQYFDVPDPRHCPQVHPTDGNPQKLRADRKSGTATTTAFILDMRSYMPRPHRLFLLHVARITNIRQFVQSLPDEANLTKSYNSCLHELVHLRNTHLKMVSRYIVIPKQQGRVQKRQAIGTSPYCTEPVKSDSASLSGDLIAADELSHRGTGGTELMPFLKRVRDTTAKTAINT